MSTNRSLFNWIPKIFESREGANTEVGKNSDLRMIIKLIFWNLVVLQESESYQLALFKNRRFCPQCNRIDRVYRADILFRGEANSIVRAINAKHLLLFPRFAAFMFAANFVHYYSFIFIYPTTGYCIHGVLSSRFVGCSHRHSVLIAILGVFYMMYRFISGAHALFDDIEKDGCDSVLTHQVGTRTRFCYFRNIRDAWRYLYICAYKH